MIDVAICAVKCTEVIDYVDAYVCMEGVYMLWQIMVYSMVLTSIMAVHINYTVECCTVDELHVCMHACRQYLLLRGGSYACACMCDCVLVCMCVCARAIRVLPHTSI